MKAKEYAKTIIEMMQKHQEEREKETDLDAKIQLLKKQEEEENKTITQVLLDFLQEEKRSILQRSGKGDQIRMSVMDSIIKEMADKWDAMARIVNKKLGVKLIREDGYNNWHKVKFKEVHDSIDFFNMGEAWRRGQKQELKSEVGYQE